MVQPGGEPNRTDALERRAEKLTEDYKQAVKMKKMDIKMRWLVKQNDSSHTQVVSNAGCRRLSD